MKVGQALMVSSRMRVEDFQIHTFSTEADPGAVRAGWKYPSEE
jgi:hypothetical protein